MYFNPASRATSCFMEAVGSGDENLFDVVQLAWLPTSTAERTIRPSASGPDLAVTRPSISRLGMSGPSLAADIRMRRRAEKGGIEKGGLTWGLQRARCHSRVFSWRRVNSRSRTPEEGFFSAKKQFLYSMPYLCEGPSSRRLA